MSSNTEPTVGSWYQYPDEGEKFEVLEVDDDRGIVEIQYADGERDEIDIEEWSDLEVNLTDPPEDWADTAERNVAAREAAPKGERDASWAGRTRRPGETDEADDDEPDDYPADESWRDED